MEAAGLVSWVGGLHFVFNVGVSNPVLDGTGVIFTLDRELTVNEGIILVVNNENPLIVQVSHISNSIKKVDLVVAATGVPKASSFNFGVWRVVY